MWAAVLSAVAWVDKIFGSQFAKVALQAWQAKLTSENTTDKIAADLAGKEIDLQQREAELQTQYRIATIGKWWEPDHLMGYAVAIYFGTLLVWDNVFKMGSHDPLGGWAGTTANVIVISYFGKRGIENVMQIWTRRKK